jgi:DNA polymerase III subunit delta'
MSNKFKTSIILQTPANSNPLEEIAKWIDNNGELINPNADIENQPNINLINTQRESVKIETIRELIGKLAFGSHGQSIQYFIIIDAHLATHAAQNALLKSLEEPPGNTQIILVTSQKNQLLETITSRCLIQHTKVKNEQILSVEEVVELRDMYQTIINSNFGELIILASKYKDRVDALKFCYQLLYFLHSELKNPNKKFETKKLSKSAQVLVDTINKLESNTNVALTLENCFFEMIAIS